MKAVRSSGSAYARLTAEIRRRAEGDAGEPAPEFAGLSTEELIERASSPQVIYGPDDRIDMYQVTDANVEAAAASVVLVVDEDALTEQSDGSYDLDWETLSSDLFDRYHCTPCANEPFVTQPIAADAVGSAFFVAEDCIATAAHVVDGAITRLRFVLGYEMLNAKQPVLNFSADQVFEAVSVVRSAYNGSDWAMVRVENQEGSTGTPLDITAAAKVPDSASLYVIGHPWGLPKKYAPNSVIRDNTPQHTFLANLDTFGGNSGSPVFDSNDDVVGILVQGNVDYVLFPSPWGGGRCVQSNPDPTTGFKGEVVQRIQEVVGPVHDLTLYLSIGSNAVWSKRKLYVGLNRNYGRSIEVPFSAPNPNTTYPIPLTPSVFGVTNIDDIDQVQLTSPEIPNPYGDDWTLQAMSLQVNGYPTYYSWPNVNFTFQDKPGGSTTLTKRIRTC